MKKQGVLENKLQQPLTNFFQIIREKESKIAWVHVPKPCEWAVYAGKKVDAIHNKPVLSGNLSGIFALPVKTKQHYFFKIEVGDSDYLLSERVLPMSGAYNFRDLGGYMNCDGRQVKWATLFRSDDLGKLTASDLKYLDTLPLLSVVDFRSFDIIEIDPDKRPASVKNNINCYINPGNILSELVAGTKTKEDVEASPMMEKIYASLVSDPACLSSYRKLFSVLQDEKNTPLVFHCSAGKDRTGMAAALILFSLGVDEATVFADYMLSNVCLEDKYAKIITANPPLASIFEAQPSYLQIGLDLIKKEHGTIEHFLTHVLEVDLTYMRKHYLF